MAPAVMPKYDELMIPTLAALKALGGSASNDELFDRVVADLGIPDEIRDAPHGDGSVGELAYRLSWSRTYLHQVGAIVRSQRGVWSITDKGEAVTDADIGGIKRTVIAAGKARRDAVKADRDAVRARRGQKRSPGGTTEPANSVVDLAEAPTVVDADVWREHLLETIGAMTPAGFERLCQRLLRESGFVRVEVTGRTGDGGIDGVGVLRVNLISFHVYFQSKKWTGSVGSPEIRNFRGAMQGRGDKGLIITTGGFTADARREATRDGAPAIDLVDGETLCDLLKDLKLGVAVKLVEEVTVEPEFFKGI
jgi:restriction system protein